MPHLKRWWEKYKDKTFLIIGIHTPEFEFEKDPKNVERALREIGIGWPVVLDNEYVNWNNFANHYWPAKYLADQNGNIVYTHFGEGAYTETERVIQTLLFGTGITSLPEIDRDEHVHGGVCFVPTPETYCGYERGRLVNPDGYRKDEVFDYETPEALPPNLIALKGKFLAAPEYVESHASGATLLLNFRATEVNLVLKPAADRAVASVILNDTLVKDLVIEKPAMYNLLPQGDLKEGILKVQAEEGNFQAYAFTFSGCRE